MSRMKSLFAVLLLTACVGFSVPQANAAPVVKVMIAGSSAMWQSMALAAYKNGACQAPLTGGCAHYTNSAFNLTDSRPAGGVVDAAGIWIVWDNVTADPTCATSCNIDAYIKVDSVVGMRAYFANPRPKVGIPAFPGPGNLIATAVWGDGSSDTLPPGPVQGLFAPGPGVAVSVGASDIRPEDALVAQCRANSALGGGLDGLNGLGYNATNAAGVCPSFPLGAGQGVGAATLSGYPGSGAKSNLVAFAITGKDPFSGATIPAATTVSVGAAPIIFVAEIDHGLAGLSHVETDQLQAVFSGTNCNASAFGLPASPIQAFLREPTSGTMNTTEYTAFRFPDQSGLSQETGVGAANPLALAPCAGGGGSRSRAIGTGEEVKHVQNAFANAGLDGIGYTFFSYGNVNSISNNPKYTYVSVYGADPIFQVRGTTYDPGQPAGALIPGAANLPVATCPGGFPCAEKNIWTGGLSFPNLRSGAYTEWSLLRLVSNGTALAAAKLLATGSQTFVVNSVPDFVPALKVGTTDPGLQLIRSHYGPGTLVNSGTTEKGRDAGGCIVPAASKATKLSQSSYEVTFFSCVVYPF